jgi:Putative protein-S-isoprenylcysteine methyltransferase
VPEDNRFASNKRLAAAVLTRFSAGFAILGAFLFLCAGSFRYWHAWLYIATLAACIFSFGVYLYRKDKVLLQKRLNSKEKEKAQKAYVLITSVAFLGTFTVCGLDYRFGWSHVPVAVVYAALMIMVGGFGLFVLTLLQNRFASRTIEIQDEQRVIDTGVYSLVRHPLYSAAIIMFSASPVALGSFYAVIPMLPYVIGIILRIRNEEEVLQNGLEGYTAYMKKVRYRLIPYVW